MGYLVQVIATRNNGDDIVAMVNMADAPDGATAVSSAAAFVTAKVRAFTGVAPVSVYTAISGKTG